MKAKSKRKQPKFMYRGLDLRKPANVVQCFARLIDGVAERTVTETGLDNFSQRLQSLGWGLDKVQGFRQQAIYKTKIKARADEVYEKKYVVPFKGGTPESIPPAIQIPITRIPPDRKLSKKQIPVVLFTERPKTDMEHAFNSVWAQLNQSPTK